MTHETTHPQVRVLRDGEPVSIDAGLVNLLRALWRLGYDTISSCEQLDGGLFAFVGFRTLADAERFVSEFGGQLIVPEPGDIEGASKASVEAGYTVQGSGGVGWPIIETKEMTRRVRRAASS